MDVEQLRTDIERNRQLRQDEIFFYQNQIGLASEAKSRNTLRRALVLLLYAHFEGFVKFVLSAYVSGLNADSLKCREVIGALSAASMSKVFQELRTPQPVKNLFRGQAPDDFGLARFAREREFVDRAYEFLQLDVLISDEVIETEWNLKPPVIRKLLYRLGFDPDALSSEDGAIEELVNRRNNIAHGSDLKGVDEATYLRLRESTFKTMSTLAALVCDSAEKGLHLKSTSNAVVGHAYF